MGFTDYLRDTRGELKHVSWPTRRQTIAFTVLVIGISVAVALYLGALDFTFSSLMKKILF